MRKFFLYNNKLLSFDRKGFTLIEIMASIAIFSLLTLGGGKIFFIMQDTWKRQRESIDAVQNLRWAMTFMINEIHHGWALSVQPGGSRTSFDIDTTGSKAPDTKVWYWRGDGAGSGDLDKIYRGLGSWPTAAANRKELTNFIVSNPSGNNLFSLSGKYMNIELTARPNPVRASGPGNENFVLKSQGGGRN